MGAEVRGTPAAAPTDAELIERAKHADHEAFRVLVERYQGRAYGLALRVLRNEEQARDAVQDAFIKVYGSLGRFEGRSGFYTWLYRLVMNVCLDMKRRDRSSRHVEWEEERAAEIAQAVGVPKGTVMSRLFYARRRVRAALVEAGVVDATPDGDAVEDAR